MKRIRHAPWARARVDEADGWLARHPVAKPILVVAANGEAASSLLRREVGERGPGAARFGASRTTLGRLATTLALPRLIAEGRRPASGLSRVALCARVLHELAGRGELGRYARVADRPGLPSALAATLHDLRMAAVGPSAVAGLAPDLSRIYTAYLEALAAAGLADRADVFASATAAARDLATGAPLGQPTLLLDVPLRNRLEERLVAAVADRAPDLLALAPSGDDPTLAHLSAALGVPSEPLRLRAGDARRHRSAAAIPAPLARLQAALFDDADLPPTTLDDPSVALLSAPGESRECVEIARRVHAEAARGVPFDRMAILLRSPDAYRAPLAEALRRADVPAWFAPGTVAPDPAGRALLALLACAAEGLTSRRFAEYLSLGEAPPVPLERGRAPQPSFALTETTPPPEPWAPPLDDDASDVIARLSAEHESVDPLDAPPILDGPVVDGRLRAPRRWEQLLDDAAVIGGLGRWRERLDHLDAELRLDLAAAEDPDSPQAHAWAEDLRLVAGLRRFALPLLGVLDALPRSADWATWLTALRDLATRALRAPDRVLGLFADLAPMGPVGPVGLDEVRLVLTRHLSELSHAPTGRPAGRVWVGTVDDARGRDFDVVFVPGLHEKSFPQRLIEDPLLLDRVRVALRAATGARLELNADRAAAERLRLRLAIGATSERLVISWSRLDGDKGRPRVPSFYGLEVLRAAEGHLPGFDELVHRAERGEARRLGWPAPDDPARAIDAAEYDLAVLHGLINGNPEDGAGLASYLVAASPHLARGLRAHARRELRRWTPADGLLLDPKAPHAGATRAALDRHSLGLRAYSATALQKWADCPYQFALYALHRLAPREVPEPVERLDPRQRGSLFHEVQFELLQRLRDDDLLPLPDGGPDALGPVLARLDEVLAEVADRYAAELAPAIERVWEDGLAAIRADLRGWLRQLAAERAWTPHRFELSFGLPGRRAKDPASTDAPVQLDVGIRLRGAIDLVERAPDETLRATDHKTGRPRGTPGMVIGGGLYLQPVLYALALEQLVPGARVTGGRLWYCTERAGWEDRVIPLDDGARGAAERLAKAIDDSVVEGFLPAYPRSEGRYTACTWCDYAPICGPDEVARTRKKPKHGLDPLIAIRKEP